ncbi:hypothetical protein BU16DRAFT_567901 [Lophium mytilinum]|uniref:Rhodopsin domain-containing protein n=1 Tax=Lophium mytilinum TaxID=390894 RepID=A0A6A6QBV1_9PEZI|nr:hypothetical protein BU16DRAFT_567901 [Lophium mytilinum]
MILIARMISRQIIVCNVGIDDWIMAVAWIGSIGLLVETIIARKHGMGKVSISLEPADMIAILKDTLAIEVTYYVTVFMGKLSILFLYLRFTTHQFLRRACLWIIYFLTTYTIMCIIIVLAQCQPIRKAWDITGQVKGTCINRTIFFYSMSFKLFHSFLLPLSSVSHPSPVPFLTGPYPVTASFNIATDI